MNETPKTKSGWRILRRILIGLAVLATLIAILYAEEDWRGKRAWENYKREWEAKDEKFDWQAFVPPSVPDDQNFFTAPVFTNLLNGKIAMSTSRADGSYPDFRQPAYWAKGTMTDLKAWQTYYRNPTNASLANEFPVAPQPQTPAADVLLALSRYASAIEELRQAGHAAQDQRQDAGCHRVKRAQMPHRTLAADASHAGDDVVRSHPRRLVNDQDAVNGHVCLWSTLAVPPVNRKLRA